MAITAALVSSGNNSLRYLLTQDGAAGATLNITSSGAATPDLRTDSLAGPLKNIANAPLNGYGILPAGNLTQAQARALWLSSPQTTVAIAGNKQVPTAICKLTPSTGAAPAWTVDANVVANVPVLAIASQAGAGTCFLDVEIQGSIGA